MIYNKEMKMEFEAFEVIANGDELPGVDFTITDEDGTKEKKSFWLPGSYFKDAFDIIKTMIPPCEETPAVLE